MQWISPKSVLTLALAMLTAPVLLCQGPANSGQAGQNNAFFTGPGTHGATLNGAPLLPGTAVLNGETVTTGPGGVAVLAPTHGGGGVIELGGNASATVARGTNALGNSGGDQLSITQGNIRVTGDVSITTPQGQSFRPESGGTSFVINAGAANSTIGVLSGVVNAGGTAPGAKPNMVTAGNAVQVETGAGGQVHITKIKFNDVTEPPPNGALTQVTPVSQSQ